MHEEALLRNLRAKLSEIGATEEPLRILRVRLWVGALAHVSDQTLRSRWSLTVKGTPAEDSQLEIEISSDLNDPRAEGIVLTRVDVMESVDAHPGSERSP
ncbi:MAG: hydrogenase/urease maturation nickel metallochaperone HypA [Thermoplasmata archaeon]